MIETMKQMVHELEYVLDCINKDKIPFDGDDFHEALRLGRQAIAEAEKQEQGEPVTINDEVIFQVLNGCSHDQKHHKIPLTREVIIEFGQKMLALGKDENWAFKADYWKRMHDKVRAELIKSTTIEQEQGEPVAWIEHHKGGDNLEWDKPGGKCTPLYTTPQRTWVGLTDEDIEASKPPLSNDAVVWELAVEWAESKLKDKNT